MKIEPATIPTSSRRNPSKYGELWLALIETGGRSAVVVRELNDVEAQRIRTAGRLFTRRYGGQWSLATRRDGDALTLWIVPRDQQSPVIGRTLQAIR